MYIRYDKVIGNKKYHVIEYYYANGCLESREYYFKGKKHNEKGPALETFYSLKDRIMFKKYYLNGVELNIKTDEELSKYLKFDNF